nr:tyrosine-type recombinase/integrase [Staphylococcus pseudintermedius]
MKYYSSDELKQFLTFVEDDPLYYAIFRTLAFTGFRRGELMALTWNDIDFNKQTITVNKTYARGLTINSLYKSQRRNHHLEQSA